ncbi:hypothetical protein [Streptomyces sp. NBC_01708]|uniref:hypothetical protein n=1 Tax=Streptomyces sp. NBC_01708 TaxID=2975915 RepID=UPI002E3686D0|nr:hypothetical protein [Streptomyces sp. NBC_01708]WSS72114.1 hypothetical protein OG491_29255 [Streptomyces sp. NBC_01175]
MTTGAPSSQHSGAEPPPLPWFGPTLHELLPDAPLGTRPLGLRRLAAPELTASAALKDSARHALVHRANQNSHTPVDALVAEILTPPLPGHDTEERP